MLAARNENALRNIAAQINRDGGRAVYVAADVGREKEVREIGRAAIEHFGRIDTWVNNAMVSIFGRLTDVSLEDHRRLFDTNYWGVVHGSLTAVEHLRDHGGVLINVGSGLSDRAIPLQGTYCASKFAVKGFTESLRMEIEDQKLPIQVTLVKPSSIDTPYYRSHAKNYLPRAPKNPPPVYDPSVVARAILHCAEHPKRDVYVGAGARLLTLFSSVFPRLTDIAMEKVMFAWQMTDQPPGPRDRHNLFGPAEDGEERGSHPNHVSKTSIYTQLSLHPLTSALLLAGAIVLAAALVRSGPLKSHVR